MPKLIRLKDKQDEKNIKEFNDFMFIRKLDLLASDRYSPEEEDAFMAEIIEESDKQLALERTKYGAEKYLEGKRSVRSWPLIITLNLGIISFAFLLLIGLKVWG